VKETIINARYYIEAGAFTSKEISRYVLSAVRVEPHPEGGAVVIATDGHTMGIFHDKEGKCEEPVTIAYRSEIARLAKAKKGLTRRLRVNGDVDILEDAKGKGLTPTPLVRFFDAILTNSSQFPNWRMVLPNAAEAKRRSDFNGEYLARCALAKREFRNEGITIFQKDGDTQAIVRTQREDFVGIVMPMKIGTENPYPSYVQPLLKPKAEPQPETTTTKPTKATTKKRRNKAA